ncbi:MAG: hypothetical protein AVDCRST_MAG30-913, partial [uncultured Solirubrobacteraceae bacterium]
GRERRQALDGVGAGEAGGALGEQVAHRPGLGRPGVGDGDRRILPHPRAHEIGGRERERARRDCRGGQAPAGGQPDEERRDTARRDPQQPRGHGPDRPCRRPRRGLGEARREAGRVAERPEVGLRSEERRDQRNDQHGGEPCHGPPAGPRAAHQVGEPPPGEQRDREAGDRPEAGVVRLREARQRRDDLEERGHTDGDRQGQRREPGDRDPLARRPQQREAGEQQRQRPEV